MTWKNKIDTNVARDLDPWEYIGELLGLVEPRMVWVMPRAWNYAIAVALWDRVSPEWRASNPEKTTAIMNAILKEAERRAHNGRE